MGVYFIIGVYLSHGTLFHRRQLQDYEYGLAV